MNTQKKKLLLSSKFSSEHPELEIPAKSEMKHNSERMHPELLVPVHLAAHFHRFGRALFVVDVQLGVQLDVRDREK